MHHRTLAFASLLACSPAAFALAQALEPAAFVGPVDAPDVMGGYASDRVIVRLAPGVAPVVEADGSVRFAAAGRSSARLAGRGAIATEPTLPFAPRRVDLAAKHRLDRYHTLHLPPGSPVRAIVAELRALDPALVEDASVDGIGGILATLPNDPSFGLQYGMNNTGQVVQGQAGVVDADLDLPEAWDLHTGTDAIVLALIDTGVSQSHPDLAPKLVAGYSALDGSSNADDSFVISHGSHCAGIAAAQSNNAAGVAGVSWGARIMPVKVLNFIGGGTETDCADGVVWAADHGAHVGSMSLGFPEGIPYFEDAINYAHEAGMVLVAATGNTPGAAVFPPARWEPVIAVGATDNTDTVASFTTTGPELDVSAPGVDVYSCWDALFQFNTYTYQSGTSMACPHVAGLACLVWSANLDLTSDEVRAIIEATAEDKGAPGFDPIYGHGRVNAFAAVSLALAPSCAAADLDCDGDIDGADVGILLAQWGGDGTGDLDGSGVVDSADLGLLLAAWSGRR